MIRFEERTGLLHATDLGRTASHFYIKYDTVEIFNERLHPAMNDAEILALISMAQEFDQVVFLFIDKRLYQTKFLKVH